MGKNMTTFMINGFGRIGRVVARALANGYGQDKNLELVAINNRAGAELASHLLQYDSVHGTLPYDVTHGNDWIDFGLGKIPILSISNPAEFDHKGLGVDIVHDCTGVFNGKNKALPHITNGGAKKVLLSAPAKERDGGADLTVVYGVNHPQITPDMQVLSNASCTTNCLAPVMKILHDTIGVVHGNMTTVHSYTGDQNIVDSTHKDFRRARAGAVSMVPSTTGAASAIGHVLPELAGKLDGSAVRVPTPNVSMIDVTFVAENPTTVTEINTLMHQHTTVPVAQGGMQGVMAYNDRPLVSCDFNGNPHSAIFDATQTQVIGNTLVRVCAWYDNETGFSHRMLDTTAILGA